MFGSLDKDVSGKISNLKMALGLVALVLTILFTWKALGFPVFATEADVKKIESKIDEKLNKLTSAMQGITSFQKDTRALLLNQDWWRIQAKIDSYKIALSKDPTNLMIRDSISELERQQQDLKRQITKIVK